MNINSLNNANENQGSGQSTDYKEKAKAMWIGIPVFVKFVILSTLILYILSWITSDVNIIMNVPNYTILKLQIWRIVTSVFYTPSIIGIIFVFIVWVPDAVRLESTSGTIRYMLNFLVNATLINLIFCVVILLISIIYKSALNTESSGLWPLIMAEISMLSLANPDNQVTLFYIPIKFSAKYYPWVLFLFYTILNMSFQIDILVGIIYGHLFFYYLRNYIQFSDNFIIKTESFSIVKSLGKITNFVPLQTSTLNSSYNYQGQYTGSNNNHGDVEAPNTGFRGQGTVLGGIQTDSETNQFKPTNQNIPDQSVERLDASNDVNVDQAGSKFAGNNKYVGLDNEA